MKKLWRKALPLLLCIVTLIVLLPAQTVMAAEEKEDTGMKTSAEYITLLKGWEGFSATPYWDVSHYSIGYGTTCPSDKVDYYKKHPMSEAEAEQWLQASLNGFEKSVNDYAKKYDLKLTQNQFDALVSFTYNCGASWTGETNGNFNTAVRTGDKGRLFMYGIGLYGSAGGDYILMRRRMREANIYLNGKYTNEYPDNYRWVFLNGGGAMPRYPVYAFDSNKPEPIHIQFSSIPTGKTADGKTFVYEFAGWYTEAGKKVTQSDSSLTRGQILYARWKDPSGKVVTLPTGTPVAEQKLTITKDKANIRNGPGTYYEKTGELKKGATLTLKEIYKVGSTTWGNTNKGWLSLGNTNYEAEPEVKLPQTGVVNANDVNYRTKPNGTKKGQYDKGTKVTITELNDTGKWGKMTNGYWIFLEYVTYDKDQVTKVELLKKPIKLNYANYKKALELEGSVVLITYADGRQHAKTIARGDVKDNRAANSPKATVTATYGSKSVSFVITFGSLKVVRQPANVAVPLDSKATVSVDAVGEDLTYQWYICNPGSTTFGKSSLTGPEYYMTVTETNSGRKVYCVIKDKSGNTVQTNTVTITSKVSIIKQPVNVTVENGEKAVTSVEATGQGLKYQWYICNPGSTTFGKSSLAGNEYYVNMKDTVSGRKVYCVITDQYGNSVKTDVVTLACKVMITQQPTDVLVKVGEKASTKLVAKGEGLQYQWYICGADDEEFIKSSLTGPEYYVTMKPQISGRKAYCIVTDLGGNSVKSDEVTLVCKAAIAKQPTNAAVNVGEKASVFVEAAGEGLTYQWYICNPGSETYAKSSLTGPEYYVTMKESVSGRKVYCIVTDQYGNTVKSDVVTLTVKLSLTKQPADVYVGNNHRASTTVEATGMGLKYQWYFCNAGSKTYSKSSLTGPEYYVTMKAHIAGRKVYCVVSDQYGNSVKSDVVTLYNKPVVTKQPADVAVVMGEQARVVVEAKGEGLTYQWYICNPGSKTYAKSSLTGNEYYVTMKDAVSGRKVYCIVTDTYGASVKTNVVTLQAKLTLVQQPENVYAQLGEQVTASVEATGAGLKYQWYICAMNGTTYTKSSLTGPEYYVTMKESVSGRTAYCVITDRHGASVKTDVITMAVPMEITRQPESGTVLMGERISTSFEASGLNLKYQWYICGAKDNTFIKSSLTGTEYYVTMKESVSGRKAYCLITDHHGNTLKTDVVTLSGVDPVKDLRSQMVARNENIVISYLQDTELPSDSTIAVDNFGAAIAHTGAATQGDYIYRHIKNLSYESQCQKQGDRYLVTLTYTVGYRTTAQQEEAVTAKVKEILDQLNVYDKTDYEKVKAVYDYLCANVTTSVLPDSSDYTAYGALVNKSAVCQGFASAFYRLMLELNVDARVISGDFGTTRHGWNIVEIDGIYYNVDATKDAGFAPADYNYFLKADSALTQHVRDEEYSTAAFLEAYPMAEADYQ